MNTESIKEQLKNTFIFSCLSENELNEITSNSAHLQYEKGELIYKQNEFNTHANYLLSGYAKVHHDTNKNKQIVKLIRPKWFIGLLSIFAYENHRFSASALINCEILSIPISILQKLIETNQLFALAMIKAVSLLGTNVTSFLILKNSKNVRGKIAEILLHLSSDIYQDTEFEMNITRKELGDIANTSTETAIRIITEFKKEGAITTSGNHVRITNIKLLEKISSLA